VDTDQLTEFTLPRKNNRFLRFTGTQLARRRRWTLKGPKTQVLYRMASGKYVYQEIYFGQSRVSVVEHIEARTLKTDNIIPLLIDASKIDQTIRGFLVEEAW
jgi:hypothetical protein